MCFLMFCFASSNLKAQTVPSIAEQERLEQRFKRPVQPKSIKEPIIPESPKSISLKKQEIFQVQTEIL
jgi:hypothetical protein